MTKEQGTNMVRLLALAAGVLFCIFVFSYGVTQEVPVGTIEGTVILAESGKPLPDAEVHMANVDDDTARGRTIESDDHGHFRARNFRAGEYWLDTWASEHTLSRFRVTIKEGQTASVVLRLTPHDPYLTIYASQRVWTPAETPHVELHGFRQGNSIKVRIQRVNFQRLIDGGMFAKAVTALRNSNGLSTLPHFNSYTSAVSVSNYTIQNFDSEGAFIDPLKLPHLKPGFYWVTCVGEKISVATYINVSQISLVTKTARGRALAFVTDLVSGKPIQNAQVWAESTPDHTVKLTTGVDGLCDLPYLPNSPDNSAKTAFLAIHDGSHATVGIYTATDSGNSGIAQFAIYTDRPIYRPGDLVQFKGIVRRSVNGLYAPPSAGPVNVVIRDPDEQPIEKLQLTANSHGAFSGRFETSAEAGPGEYSIVASGFGGSGSGDVQIASYRKPEFSIDIKPLKPNYVIGDKADVAITCTYYFGGPVVGMKLSASAFANQSWESGFDPADQDDGENNDESQNSGGDLYQHDNLVTDEKGQAVLHLNTKKPNSSIPLRDLEFNINVSGTDASQKYVEQVAHVLVTRGDFNVSAAAQNDLIQPGKTIRLSVKTSSNNVDRAPVSGRKFSVDVSTEKWVDDEVKQTHVATYNGETDTAGYANLDIPTTKPGSIRLKVTAYDDRGHPILAEQSVYVLGRWNDVFTDEAKLQVTLDKRRYKVGDTAQALVRTISPGGSALITAQADRVLWRKVVPLTDKLTLVSVPVSAVCAPNCFVSVAYVRRKTFYEGSARLSVDPEERKLKVTIQSDLQVYLPGSMAKLTVSTTDYQNHPVPAECSVGVVDESIYAIREDSFDMLETFYPKRRNGVTTSYSFEEVYLDGGDKGGGNIPIRRIFRDTAAWIPSVQTDLNGKAQVTVQLPDNLTQWRATVVGVTDTTVVGKSTTKFEARKPLMARLEMPDYLVQMDERQMSVLITNDTGTEQDIHVAVAARGITIVGKAVQTVRVSTDKPTSLDFEIKTGNPGTATVTAKAWIPGGPSDGVEQSFPILAHGLQYDKAWTDEVQDTKDFDVVLPANADQTTGRLKITATGSLAGGLIGALDGLIDFPYGCVEQTMDRFMPSVLVADAIHKLGLPQIKQEKEVPKIAADSMIRLARMQHEDGGWGWWQYDASDPFMTALVLDGLDRAKRVGVAIHKIDLTKAVAWCLKRVESPSWKDDTVRAKSYVIYALARYGHAEVAAKELAKIPYRFTSAADLATLSMAAGVMGPAHFADRDRLLDDLMREVHQGPMGAYWASSEWELGSENTSLPLAAIMVARPDDPIVPRVVRYLMARRRGDMWDSTRDTAYALIGLTQYVARSRDLGGAFTAKISVNGHLAKTVDIDARKTNGSSVSFEIPTSEMRPGTNVVRVEKTNKGTCYVALDMKCSVIMPTIQADSPVQGLKVVRKYYRMEVQKLEDGTMSLQPSKRPVASVDSGDTVQVDVTITTNKSRQFIMIEDPTPSNCRVTEREDIDSDETWSYWWNQIVVRDDRVAFFIRDLPEGSQTITYTMKAEETGIAHALPTSLTSMYDVSVHTRGDEAQMEVK